MIFDIIRTPVWCGFQSKITDEVDEGKLQNLENMFMKQEPYLFL